MLTAGCQQLLARLLTPSWQMGCLRLFKPAFSALPSPLLLCRCLQYFSEAEQPQADEAVQEVVEVVRAVLATEWSEQPVG